MRTTTLTLSVTLSIVTASSAIGGPIVFSQVSSGSGSEGTSVPAPPKPIILQAGQEGDPPSERVTLRIPSLPADDPERILHYSPDDGLSRSWVITPDNAADYCFDWDAFEAALNGDEARIALALGKPASFEPMIAAQNYVGNFRMDRIEIDLDYWFWHPVLPSLQAYRVEGRIIGEAQIVPEPATWLLASIAPAGVWMRRTRRVRCE
jgi:hypothetical protein